MSNASNPGTRGKARRNAAWKRSGKKEASDKTGPAPWDPYMLSDVVDSDEEEVLRLEASLRAAAKTELAAKTEESAVVAKSEGVEGLQDVAEQRVRCGEGQIPAKKSPINSLRAAAAVSASAPAATSESSAPSPIQHSAPLAHQGVRTKRRAPGVTAHGSMTQERLVQVKEPELPPDEPAPQERVHVAGNLNKGARTNSVGDRNLQAKMEGNNGMDDNQNGTMGPSVSKSEPGPERRRVIQQGAGGDDWRNCDPPQCVDCGEHRWPTWTSKKGRVHCGFCFRPDGGRPSCISCGKTTWDGLAGPGKKWFCETCFIDDRAVEMHPLWTSWFRERRKLFPEAFANNGPALFYEGSACANNACANNSQEEEADTRWVVQQQPSVPWKNPHESDTGRLQVKDEEWQVLRKGIRRHEHVDPTGRLSSPVPVGRWRGKTPSPMPARSWTKQGQRVRLRGLHRRAEWNGACGTICEFQEDAGGGRRVTVAVDACYLVTVKDSNVEQLAPTARPSSRVGNQCSSRSRSPRQVPTSIPRMKKRLPTLGSRVMLRAAAQARLPSSTRRIWHRRPPRSG